MPKKNIFLLTFLFMLPTLAIAQPKIEISSTVEKEISVKQNGKEIVTRVIADNTNPESSLFYTLSYINSGDESAKNIAIINPIPENTTYVAGSASGADTEITFSIDNGKSYKKPALLTYEVNNPAGGTDKKSASPEQYTHIRWIVDTIPAGAAGEVGFEVTVK